MTDMRLIRFLFGLYVSFVSALQTPIVLSSYFARSTGRQYGIGFRQKIGLFLRMRRNYRVITSASHYIEHLAMATAILNIPRETEGCVVECGS
ncbi:MAG TPA: hypothetical protein VJX67_19805, partial [Blastocatellia bacterium]|nr:hypothetical protein [Blastocatellia bacterium]